MPIEKPEESVTPVNPEEPETIIVKQTDLEMKKKNTVLIVVSIFIVLLFTSLLVLCLVMSVCAVR